MKLRKKISAMIVSICLILPLFCTPVMAASGSISLSGGSGNVGDTVTVNCSISSDVAIGGATVVVEYNPNMLQFVSATGGAYGGSGSVIYAEAGDGSSKKFNFSMTFKIVAEGSHSLSASSSDAFSWDEEVLSVSGASATIKGKTSQSSTPSGGGNTSSENNPPAENDNRDSNNKLGSLSVSPGTLSPTFNVDTTSYSVTVDKDITEVSISAKAASDKAKVKVSGGSGLKLGENYAKVVVTAENGSTKTYNLTIICGEIEKITVNDKVHTINESFGDDVIPAGFAREKATYNERTYEAVVGAGGLTLMNLQNEEGSAFYIYDQATQSFHPFTKIGLDEGKYIIPLPLSEADTQFADYEQIILNLNDQNITAWKLDDEFSVLKVINQDGTELYYRFDSVDGTYQRYVEIQQEEAGVIIEGNLEDVVEPEPFYVTYSQYLMLGAGAVAILFIILTIVLGVKLRKTNTYEEDEDELYEEEVNPTESKDVKAEQIEEKIDNPDDDWDV